MCFYRYGRALLDLLSVNTIDHSELNGAGVFVGRGLRRITLEQLYSADPLALDLARYLLLQRPNPKVAAMIGEALIDIALSDRLGTTRRHP